MRREEKASTPRQGQSAQHGMEVMTATGAIPGTHITECRKPLLGNDEEGGLSEGSQPAHPPHESRSAKTSRAQSEKYCPSCIEGT